MSRLAAAALALSTVLVSGLAAEAGPFKVPYRFQAGLDGASPLGAPVKDAAGNLYGSTSFGGNGAGCPVANHEGCGTVYKIAPDGTESVLHAFTGGLDGRYPQGGLILDPDGNLYGTTWAGGSSDCQERGCGTVFKVAPNGTTTILHVFPTGADDGSLPVAGLVRDGAGNLYGTASSGNSAQGVVFKIAASDGTYSILHAFNGNDTQQGYPNSLIIDKAGNLYGTTGNLSSAHLCTPRCGTVFKIARNGAYRNLHVFTGGAEGTLPFGALARDSQGNLYGTTYNGGAPCAHDAYGCGTVFKITAGGAFSVVYSFAGGTDGRWPLGALAIDKNGNVYGTTTTGGTGCNNGGCGTVFKIAADGSESILHAFYGKQGQHPQGGVTKDNTGVLYGTAAFGFGTADHGTVFKIRP